MKNHNFFGIALIILGSTTYHEIILKDKFGMTFPYFPYFWPTLGLKMKKRGREMGRGKVGGILS